MAQRRRRPLTDQPLVGTAPLIQQKHRQQTIPVLIQTETSHFIIRSRNGTACHDLTIADGQDPYFIAALLHQRQAPVSRSDNTAIQMLIALGGA